MKSSLRVVTTFVTGAFAGVVAGVLFAPSKGRKNRKKNPPKAKASANEEEQK